MHKKNTLFIGKVLLHFPRLNSTNQYALDVLSKSRPVEGTVISTFEQTEGRGQIGSRWESEPNKNLALSVIVYPSFLAIRQQFLLNQAVALGVRDCIAKITELSVKVKWPNDIYISCNKISGILIQNTLSSSHFLSSVIGIGINVNQTEFPADLPNPTSLCLETGREFSLSDLTSDLCFYLETWYLRLRQGKYEDIRSRYLDHLYRFQEPALFQDAHGHSFQGRITGVSETGKLCLAVGQQERQFDLKEIRFL